MGTIIKSTIVFFLLLTFYSCKLLEQGYYNEKGEYLPKRPNFKLKELRGGEIPKNLDTINVYKLKEIRNLKDEIVYDINSLKQYPESFFTREYSKINLYFKFYNNGRCSLFSIPSKDDLGLPNTLKEEHINPKNPDIIHNRKYYYCTNDEIVIEHFIPGDGYGQYNKVYYKINTQGDTIASNKKKGYNRFYIKEELPKEWKKYSADW